MELIGATSIESAVTDLRLLRNCKPYQYGGCWFVAMIAGKVVAVRQLATLKKQAMKSGQAELSYTKVCPQ